MLSATQVHRERRNMTNSQSISSDKRAYHQYLFDAENAFMADTFYFPDKKAVALRRIAISTFETCSKCNNFDAMIPFLALTYYDRLVSRHQIERVLEASEDNEDLFVICCLTIAWKLRTKSFKLDSFLNNAKTKYKLMDVFSMEIDILNKLDWRVRPVTPINFADYFMELLPRNEQNRLADRIVKEFIVKIHADYRTSRYRPSVIAAYAISATTSKLFPGNQDTFLAALRESCPKADGVVKDVDRFCRGLDGKYKKKLVEVIAECERESGKKAAAAAEGEAGSSSSSVAPGGGRRGSPVERETSEGPAVAGRRDGKAPMVEEKAEEEAVQEEEEEEEEEEEGLQLSFELQWGRYLEGEHSLLDACVAGLLAWWDRITARFSAN